MLERIIKATWDDADEILALYRTMLGGLAAWNENYPCMDNIEFDLNNNDLYVMKNEKNEIVATISIDHDEEVEALTLWSKDLVPVRELARLCVRVDYQNRGIARQMMNHVFADLKEAGVKGVHILVKSEHYVALQSYSHLGYVQVGECDLYDRHFVCLEKRF